MIANRFVLPCRIINFARLKWKQKHWNDAAIINKQMTTSTTIRGLKKLKFRKADCEPDEDTELPIEFFLFFHILDC